MTLPALIVTGASGFVGHHLLNEIKEEYRIFAIARRSQRESGAPIHPNIAWMQVDIRHRDELARTMREIVTAGGARDLIHLAAYYDFTGDERPEYRSTNVEGTRNVIELSLPMNLRRFVFASSVAACSFPRPEGPLDERTPPDGDHVYARSKRQGEAMLGEYPDLPSCIVRLGAVYSDWCEYAPLYVFLSTWLGRSWRSRVLAGRGSTAIPYVHIRDVIAFFRHLLARLDAIEPREVLIASRPGCTSHRTLQQLSTRAYFGCSHRPIHLPKFLCTTGLLLADAIGRLSGRRPFERRWMGRYIDLTMEVDNRRTRERLGWTPSPRHQIERRLPFVIERLKSEPLEWHVRNAAAMRRETARPDLSIYRGLVAIEDQIIGQFVHEVRSATGAAAMPHYAAMDPVELAWLARLVYRLLLTSVQTSDRLLIVNYLEVTAAGRFRDGCSADEIGAFLGRMSALVRAGLAARPELRGLDRMIHDRVSVPFELGLDEVQGQFELYTQAGVPARGGPAVGTGATADARVLLEETIWRCLVLRR